MTVIKSAVITGAPVDPTGEVTLSLALVMEGIPGSVTVATDSNEEVSIPLVLKEDLEGITKVTIGNQTHVIDNIDPTSTAYGSGRGPEQLNVYTSKYGSSTKTNKWGVEVVVVDNVVTAKPVAGQGNMDIPRNGLVLSGHNTAGEWLKKYATVDAEVVFA